LRTDNIEIVVADLLYPMNIGSIARVMSCAGFKELTLVRPCKEWNSMDAVKFSLFGKNILENAKVCKSLEDIKDDSILFGFSRRIGKKRSYPVMLTELASFMKRFRNKKKIKLVFGGESAGLNTGDIRLCDHMVTIDPGIIGNSLSLPVAVSMVIYELKKSYLVKDTESGKRAVDKGQAGALFERVKKLLLKTGFIDSKDEKRTAAKLQNIIKRLSTSDVKLLHSILQYIGENKNEHERKKR
jgi:tRNA/rRNA methyltransferase